MGERKLTEGKGRCCCGRQSLRRPPSRARSGASRRSEEHFNQLSDIWHQGSYTRLWHSGFFMFLPMQVLPEFNHLWPGNIGLLLKMNFLLIYGILAWLGSIVVFVTLPGSCLHWWGPSSEQPDNDVEVTYCCDHDGVYDGGDVSHLANMMSVMKTMIAKVETWQRTTPSLSSITNSSAELTCTSSSSSLLWWSW